MGLFIVAKKCNFFKIFLTPLISLSFLINRTFETINEKPEIYLFTQSTTQQIIIFTEDWRAYIFNEDNDILLLAHLCMY